MIDLKGTECEPFQISISMPGNCEDFIVEGSLLVGKNKHTHTHTHTHTLSLSLSHTHTHTLTLSSSDPPYPKVEELMMVVLENKTIFLTWQQPYNIFDEDSFTYNITVMSNGHNIVDHRVITLNTSQVPWVEFNFTNLEYCDEVNFTLTQEGDCREQHISTFLPICKKNLLAIQLYTVKFYYSSRRICVRAKC